LTTLAKFATVGLTGLVVNTVTLYLLSHVLSVPYLAGVIAATQVSTAWNFGLSERWVFGHAARHSALAWRLLQFAALNNAALLARGPVIVALTEVVGLHFLVSNLLSLVAFTVFRFTVADRLIWRGAGPGKAAGAAGPKPARPVVVVRPPSGWLAVVGVLAVAVPAVLLRVLWLDAVGLNSDEIVYAGQGGSIGGDTELLRYFPVFRAHPLLFQTVLSLVFRDGVSSLAGRLVAVAFGLATVAVTWLLGRGLYGPLTGAIAALLLAVMPYHVVVSRQILLDGPMVLFATTGLHLLARYADSGRAAWLYSASAAFGLMFVTNERSIVLLGGVYGFLAMSAERIVPARKLLLSAVILVLVAVPYPLSVRFSGRSSTGEQFLAWQLFRRANHGPGFYPGTVVPALGLAVLVLATTGWFLARRHRTWREALLAWWIVVPVVFFQLWNVKGYQYLLPLAPVVAVLAARTLAAAFGAARALDRRAATAAAWSLLALATLAPARASLQAIDPDRPIDELVAGTGGVPGGREAGLWIRDNVPEGSTLLAIGPSMANIIQFYGDRRAYGLSVSPNPLHRNPVYKPVINPDLQLRSSEIQYLVWDSFSAGRTEFFTEKLLTFAERYHGRVVHTESVTVDDGDGVPTQRPIVVIYEVRP
jgi:putative flippase GtrA